MANTMYLGLTRSDLDMSIFMFEIEHIKINQSYYYYWSKS